MPQLRVRGWFPRQCVVAIDKTRTHDADDGDISDTNKKTD